MGLPVDHSEYYHVGVVVFSHRSSSPSRSVKTTFYAVIRMYPIHQLKVLYKRLYTFENWISHGHPCTICQSTENDHSQCSDLILQDPLPVAEHADLVWINLVDGKRFVCNKIEQAITSRFIFGWVSELDAFSLHPFKRSRCSWQADETSWDMLFLVDF